MKQILISISILIQLATVIQVSKSQPQFNFDQLKQNYKNDYAVYLKNNEHLFIEIKDGKLAMEVKHHTQILLLDQQAKVFSDKSIFYTEAFSRIENISALSWVSNGKKLSKQAVETINQRKPVSNGVFYDDTREHYFIYPAAQEGAVLELSYTEKIFEPRFTSPFYFTNYIPSEEATYSITWPEQVKINYRLFGDTSRLTKKIIKEKNEVTYTWTIKNPGKIESFADSPPASYLGIHIVPWIESYTVNAEPKMVLHDVSSLYNWYSQLATNTGFSTDDELQKLVRNIISGLKTNEEKTKAIYYWVQENIKYIAWEDGLGGFIPRNALLVYNRRYGDCKDMANLTVNLLKLAGMDAWLTWIGTRHIPYTYNEVPTPASDNHMIATVKQNNQWLFLDATAQFGKYGMPTYNIQGKEALIGLNEKQFEIVTVPVIEAKENRIVDSISVEIIDQELTGSGSRIMEGFEKYKLVANWLAVSPAKRTEKFEEILRLGNNKCKTTVNSFSGYDNKDSNLVINYHFGIQNYLTRIDDAIFVNMNLEKEWQNSQIDTAKRKNAIENDFAFLNENMVQLKIPDGYVVTKMPDQAEFHSPEFGFSISYRINNQVVICSKKIYNNSLLINAEQFDKWNQMIVRLNQSYKQVVELKKN